MKQLVLASGNAGKLREIQAILADKDIQLRPQSDFSVAEAEETGLSFVENSIIKARNACLITGLPALADDSGIEVDALRGRPGIYSARYAGVEGPNADSENNKKLLLELADVPEANRGARFHCAIVFMRHENDPMPLIFQASWEGRITFEEVGSNGFGYDPLFFLPSHGCVSAELDPKIKNSISHRGQALKQLSQCSNFHL